MRRVGLLLLAGLATGCAQPDRADPALVLQEALASHQASLAGIAPRPAAAGGEGTLPPPPQPATHPAAIVQGLREAPPTMAGQLVGHPPDRVTAWLGAPRLRREEGQAEIWHYQGPQCHLDLVLYRDDAPGGGMRVAFAAARAIGTTRRGEAACLRDIARGPSQDRLPPVPDAGPEAPAPLPEPSAVPASI
ncbi:hypothetical protein [Falsiroseomonas tokyonensis]|uniref:Uncharacterized protein n=1 Tax=Falsiroseomonas tokyonensis TaxID=430521 RepID=A0ABV7BPB3_9PROT|nr:hypothetical protein [Falsiroseomonas tokyonensis]MBU8536882.1 hypothetical protein [Falsiroseomonas tokyonensis]